MKEQGRVALVMRRGAAAGGGTEAETGGEIRTKAEEGQGETR